MKLSGISGGYIKFEYVVLTVICQACQTISSTVEESQNLCLSIQDSSDLIEAMKLFFKDEILTENSAYFCCVCNKTEIAKKTMKYDILSEIRNIQFWIFNGFVDIYFLWYNLNFQKEGEHLQYLK